MLIISQSPSAGASQERVLVTTADGIGRSFLGPGLDVLGGLIPPRLYQKAVFSQQGIRRCKTDNCSRETGMGKALHRATDRR
jgi:hypothetical protein